MTIASHWLTSGIGSLLISVPRPTAGLPPNLTFDMPRLAAESVLYKLRA